MIDLLTVEIKGFFDGNPLLGLLLTLVVFYGSQKLYHKLNEIPLLHPVLVSIVIIIGTLMIFDIDYVEYMQGGQLVHFFLGPATVALAWPLYQHIDSIKRLWFPILVSVSLGILVGATSAIYLAHWLGASVLTQLSLAPKSVTTPVAIAVVEKIGGLPALTAGFVIITGVVGAMFGTPLFKWLGIRDEKVKGIAMGVSAHGVGTARAWQINHTMGTYSGLAMTVAALLIAFILPPWLKLLNLL
jgi:predicted murein hydrolase (TIGR00659 family)